MVVQGAKLAPTYSLINFDSTPKVRRRDFQATEEKMGCCPAVTYAPHSTSEWQTECLKASRVS